MSEVTIEATPCVWMGHMDDLTESRFDWAVGWAFFTDVGQWATALDLSPHYMENVQAVRKPIVVMCPMQTGDGRIIGTPFCVDKLSTEKREPWDVTVDLDSLVVGQKPTITVSPSIHIVGYWHGWLQDGTLHQ